MPTDERGELDSQRKRTDASLGAERMKTDRTLQVRSGRNEDEANSELSAQRTQADAELRGQRLAADDRGDDASEPSADLLVRLQEERRQADALLRTERQLADATIERERERRAALEVALFVAERKQTDQDLSDERDCSDRAVAGIAAERAARAAAEVAAHAREELLQVVAHDLKNPLSVIGMNLTLICNHAPAGDAGAKIRRWAEMSGRAAGRMARLVTDLLDVSSIERMRLTVVPVEQDVATLLRETIEVHAPLATERGVLLDAHVAEGLPLVRVDPQRIAQVLGNLIDNALRHTPPGGSVALGADRSGPAVRFSVRDSGPGVSADRLHAIFERGEQASPPGVPGTAGLGLYIARGIIAAHGGRIWCESTGGGAAFFFELPTV